jgi:hypothetical protein
MGSKEPVGAIRANHRPRFQIPDIDMTGRARGGPNEIGDVEIDTGRTISRVNLDTVTVGENGDGEATSDGRLRGPDGLYSRRKFPLGDKVLRRSQEFSVGLASGLARTASVVSGGEDRVEVRVMMWDTGCTYTLLTPEVGRWWDGKRDHHVTVTGFVGEEKRGRGGGMLYVLMKDTDGMWRVECLGKAYVVEGATECLMGGQGAQKHGLGGTLRPDGGAHLLSKDGVKYELVASEEDGVYRVSYIVVPTEFGEARVGQVVSIEDVPARLPTEQTVIASIASAAKVEVLAASRTTVRAAMGWRKTKVRMSEEKGVLEYEEAWPARVLNRVAERRVKRDVEDEEMKAERMRMSRKDGERMRKLRKDVKAKTKGKFDRRTKKENVQKEKKSRGGGADPQVGGAPKMKKKKTGKEEEDRKKKVQPRRVRKENVLPDSMALGETSEHSDRPGKCKSGEQRGGGRVMGGNTARDPSTPTFEPKVEKKSKLDATATVWKPAASKMNEAKSSLAQAASAGLCGQCVPTTAAASRSYVQVAVGCSCTGVACPVKLGGVLKRQGQKLQRQMREKREKMTPVSEATTRKRRMRQGVSGRARPGGRKYSSDEFARRLRVMKAEHLKWNHASASKLNEMVKAGKVEGGMLVTTAMLSCPSCWRSKMTKPAQSKKHAKRPPGRFAAEVEYDLFEPAKSTRRNPKGYKYIASFICRAVGLTFRYAMKGKKAANIMESIRAFESFLREIGEEVRAKHGYYPRIETIVMDTEGGSTTTFGYRKSMADAELIAKDIKRRFVGSGDSHAGGVERSQRTMDESVVAMMTDSGLDDAFYYFAAAHQTEHYNQSMTSSNKLGNGMAPYEWLGLRRYRPERLRPFGALAHRYVKNEDGVKGLQRGQRCVFLGYSGDVELGYIVIDLDRRTLVAGPGIKVDTNLGPARDLVSEMRADPFRCAEHADLVWKIWRFEPRAVLKKEGEVVSEGVIIDELGPDGLQVEPPSNVPSGVSEEKRKKGEKSGVIPTEPNMEPLIQPHSQSTIGTDSNPDSRRALLDQDEARPTESGDQAQRVTKQGRKLGKMEDEKVAALLIKEAEKRGWRLKWKPYVKGGKKSGVPTMSAERLAIYSRFTSMSEVQRARETPIAYEHTARTAAKKKNDFVMTPGDLKNDVARGMCEFYDGVRMISLKTFADALREKGMAPVSKKKQSVEADVSVEAGASVEGGGAGEAPEDERQKKEEMERRDADAGGNRVVEVFDHQVGVRKKSGSSSRGSQLERQEKKSGSSSRSSSTQLERKEKKSGSSQFSGSSSTQQERKEKKGGSSSRGSQLERQEKKSGSSSRSSSTQLEGQEKKSGSSSRGSQLERQEKKSGSSQFSGSSSTQQERKEKKSGSSSRGSQLERQEKKSGSSSRSSSTQLERKEKKSGSSSRGSQLERKEKKSGSSSRGSQLERKEKESGSSSKGSQLERQEKKSGSSHSNGSSSTQLERKEKKSGSSSRGSQLKGQEEKSGSSCGGSQLEKKKTGQEEEAGAVRQSTRKGRAPVSYKGMAAQTTKVVKTSGSEGEKERKKKKAPTKIKSLVSLKSVVKVMQVKAQANFARAEREMEKVQEGVRETERVGRCAAAAAKLLGFEEIGGKIYSPKDAAMIRANIAYCEEAAKALGSNRASPLSGDMPMWLCMAVKQKVQVEVDGMFEPLNIMDAMKMKEARLWVGAVKKEVAGLVALDCWDEVDRSSVPRDRTIAPSHFVFKIKTEEKVEVKVDEVTGEERRESRLAFVKCKARLVYGGHMSKYGSDYEETAAFVCNPKTVRAMLALAAPRGYKVVAFDVAQAFYSLALRRGRQGVHGAAAARTTGRDKSGSRGG